MQKYITTPIYYLNGLPHIGHAYTSILGDVMKKFEQMRGNGVYYTTGTDEHGQKNQHSIEASGLAADEFLTRQSDNFRNLFVELGIDFDYFVRTSRPEHKKIVQEILQNIYDKGLIVKSRTKDFTAKAANSSKRKATLTKTAAVPTTKRRRRRSARKTISSVWNLTVNG